MAKDSTYTDSAHMIEVHSARQKVTSVRFRITDTVIAGVSPPVPRLTLTTLAMLVGTKPGLWRSDTTRRMS